MSNMSLADRDIDLLTQSIHALLMRRKQLCPWKLSVKETERLYIPQVVHDFEERMGMPAPTKPSIHRTNNVALYANLPSINRVTVNINVGTSKIMGSQANEIMPLRYDGPGAAQFVQWVQDAYRVQVVNELVAWVTNTLFTYATTYPQIFKALPETMAAVLSHNTTTKRINYHHLPAHAKMVEANATLLEKGAIRARSLPDQPRKIVERYRGVVENTLAGAVLLPNHHGIGARTAFDNTWLRGQYFSIPEEFV